MPDRRVLMFVAGAVLVVALGFVGAYAGSKATEDRQAALEVTGTPVASLADCPWGEASCVLALSIERALRLNRVDAVVDFAEPAFYECPGRPQQSPDEPFPLCEGAPGFTRMEGYIIAERFSDADVVNQEGLRAFVQDFVDRVEPDASDEIGDGAIQLFSFGCPERATPFLNVSCARLAIILSAITRAGGETQREIIVFWAVGLFRGETLPVTEVWTAVVEQAEEGVLFKDSGFVDDLGEVYVIDQSLRRLPE